MEMEMGELRSERDLAQSQADELRHKLEVQVNPELMFVLPLAVPQALGLPFSSPPYKR